MAVAEFLDWGKDDPQRHGRIGLDAALRPEPVSLEIDRADLYRDIEFEEEFAKGQPVAAGGH
jgi:hypothetical protein